jgi:hypothetical protein
MLTAAKYLVAAVGVAVTLYALALVLLTAAAAVSRLWDR